MNQTSDYIDEHLLLQYLQGKTDERESRQIEEWLSKSAENRTLLDKLEKIWVETGKISPAPVAVDITAARKRISSRIAEYEKEHDGRHPYGKLIRMQVVRWAAGVAAVILIALGIWWLAGETTPLDKHLLVASVEEVVKDTLPDGSLVTLNMNSSLIYPEEFGEDIREVVLMGEAFFEVKHDPAQPFIVKTKKAGIKVLGTAFDVKAYPDESVEVVVNSGSVFFFRVNPQTGDTASVTLTEGMKGILCQHASQPEIDPEPDPGELFWLNQILEFRQTKLNEVIRILSSCYHVSIRLENEEIGRCKLTAGFSEEPIELILQVIADTFNLTLEKENETYVFKGNVCSEADR